MKTSAVVPARPRRGQHIGSILCALLLPWSGCAAEAVGDETLTEGELTEAEVRAHGEVAVTKAALLPAQFTPFTGVEAIEVRAGAFSIKDPDGRGFGIFVPSNVGFSGGSPDLPDVQFFALPNESGVVALTNNIDRAVGPVRSELTNLSNFVSAVNGELVQLKNRVNSIPPPATSCSGAFGAFNANNQSCVALQCAPGCRQAPGGSSCNVLVGNLRCEGGSRNFDLPSLPGQPRTVTCPGICCICP